MPSYPGSVVASPLQLTYFGYIADELNAFGLDYYPYHASTIPSAKSGPVSQNPPVTLDGIRSLAGAAGPGFSRDWYLRVHVYGLDQSYSPPKLVNPIALGNLLSTQSRQVEVWNAHFAAKLLSSITGTGTSGMTLTGPTPEPTSFGPLESRLYSIQITNDGAPQIDAAYTFVFPGEAPVLRITGSRVSVWKYRPNWRREIVERWAWLTDVLTAYDHSEQRVRLRAQPRREYEFEALAHGADRQRLENALWGWQHRVFAVPIWQDRRTLTAAAASGATSLSLSTADAEFEAGSLLVLMNDTQTAEAAEILSVSTNTLTLKLPLQNAWAAGTRVYPARLGRIGESQKFSRITSDVIELVVTFRFEDAGAWLTAQDSTATYRGLPVLEDKPDWIEEIDGESLHKISEFDYQTGGAFTEYEGAVPVRIHQFRWVCNGRSAIDRLRRWLYARSGRLTPFWYPSQADDFTVTQPIGSTSTQITVTHTGYALFAKQQTGRKDIRIQTVAGAVYYRRIVDASEWSASEEILQIDSALGVTLQPSDIRMVSFLSLCRLNQDRIEIAWVTDQIAQCAHTVRGLNYDV